MWEKWANRETRARDNDHKIVVYILKFNWRQRLKQSAIKLHNVDKKAKHQNQIQSTFQIPQLFIVNCYHWNRSHFLFFFFLASSSTLINNFKIPRNKPIHKKTKKTNKRIYKLEKVSFRSFISAFNRAISYNDFAYHRIDRSRNLNTQFHLNEEHIWVFFIWCGFWQALKM